MKFEVNQLVKSKLPQHNLLTHWRVYEVLELDRGNRYLCTAAHDTKSSNGFDAMHHDFKENEIKEI